eukprot:342362_1
MLSFLHPVHSIIKRLSTHLLHLRCCDADKRDAAAKMIEDNLFQMQFMLYGDCCSNPNTSHCKQLQTLLLENDIIKQFAEYLLIKEPKTPSETDILLIYGYIRNFNSTCKTVWIPTELTNIFIKLFPVFTYSISPYAKSHARKIMEYVIKRGTRNGCDEYIISKTNDRGYNVIIHNLLISSHDASEAQNNLSVVQSMVKRSKIASMILCKTDVVKQLFTLTQLESLDISSMSFRTLELLLTRNNIGSYLKENHVLFFSMVNKMIACDNYVKKRGFLQLLFAILANKKNFNAMIQYISEKQNLKIHMQLLKHPSKAMARDAFNVFKIFVVNPKKTRDIHIVLWRNKEKLVKFLKNFHMKGQECIEDTRILITHIKELPIPDAIKQRIIQKQLLRAKPKTAICVLDELLKVFDI